MALPANSTYSPSLTTALVIEPHLPHLLFALSTLSSLGFDVSVAQTFKDAKTALATARPDLLLTAVRLHEYNGLHLVQRGKSLRSDLAAVVTSQVDDPVLRQNSTELGATFVLIPTSADELRAAIIRTLMLRSAAVPFVLPPFERRGGPDRRSASARGGIETERRLTNRRRD